MDLQQTKLQQNLQQPTNKKYICPVHQVTCGEVSEIFHFVWLEESVLLLKKKTQNLNSYQNEEH